jgi:hypothetical protein
MAFELHYMLGAFFFFAEISVKCEHCGFRWHMMC